MPLPNTVAARRTCGVCVALLLSVAAPEVLDAQRDGAPAASAAPMSTEARAFLEAALDSLQRLSRHRLTAPWPAIRDSARALAHRARTPTETYGAVLWAVDRLDEHGNLLVPRSTFTHELLPGRIGYLRVPSFNGPATTTWLADSLQTAIRALDAAGACGWVVDLRWNTGGNVWPMLAGVGPLLGDSVAMISDVSEGRRWTMYRDGLSFERSARGPDRPYTRVAVAPAKVRDPLAPVAVLVDSMTASSGEALAIAFLGRPNVRLFGTASNGLSSVNRNVRLAEGVEMLVTVGVMRDRHDRPYGGRIMPDEIVPALRAQLPRASDATVARALRWHADRSACGR